MLLGYRTAVSLTLFLGERGTERGGCGLAAGGVDVAGGGLGFGAEDTAGGVGAGSSAGEGFGPGREPFEAASALFGRGGFGLFVEDDEFSTFATGFPAGVEPSRALAGTAALAVAARHVGGPRGCSSAGPGRSGRR